MKTTFRFIAIVLGVFAANLFSIAQQNPQADALKKYIEDARLKWEVPAVAVGIIYNDTIVLLEGFGEREIGTGKTVDENTMFAVASNTKAFTAAAIGMLVDEGKADWDDPVTKYLPWFKLYHPYVTENLTIRDLLSHRSGLTTFSGDLIWYGSDHSRNEILRRARYLKAKHGFRAEFGYSNILYLAAGQIVEQISGMSWDDFLKQRIFEPLGMDHTNTSISSLDLKGNTSIPHNDVDDKVVAISYLNWDNIGPAGSINSSASDMLKWIRLQLNNGKINDQQLVSSRALREMRTPQTVQGVSQFSERLWPSTHFKSYGLGWGLMDYHGKKVISHSGGYDGMISYSGFVPEANLGFVILTNKNSTLYYPLMYKILDTFLSSEDFDWSDYFFDLNKRNEEAIAKTTTKDSEETKVTSPTLPLEKYCGIYRAPMYGDVTIEMVKGGLYLKFAHTPIFHSPLKHLEYNTFTLKFADVPSLSSGKAAFVIGMGDKVEQLKIDVPNPDFDFTELELIKID